MNPRIRLYSQYVLLAAALFLAACGAQKENGGSKNMQNLTARFNILYNAQEQYTAAEETVFSSIADDYTKILPVYREPTTGAASAVTKALDSISNRADAIIAQKSQSNYVDDAWMLKGKVNYLRADFYTAAEFFNYVQRNWYDDRDLRQEALFWKARTLMRLNDLDKSAIALDSALRQLTGDKRAQADIYAAEAQFNILSENFGNAAAMLNKALKAGSNRQNTIRWSFVLAQLQERLGKQDSAFALYSSVVKSNAPFEMAFNANLNRLRLQPGNSTAESRMSALLALAKQYKNRDFQDQIYFRIGEIYLEQGKRDEAFRNYRLGIDRSTANRNQKGLIYLKVADLSFADADYVRAKNYYDSTLLVLGPDYPGYGNVRVKAANLDFLSARYREISRQDTLQMLAKLPEGDIQPRIGAIVREQLKLSTPSAVQQQPGPFLAAIDLPDKGSGTEGKFYFNNPVAIGQGFADFKKKWGNRKLEDNWRRSGASSSDVQTQTTGNQNVVSNMQPPPAQGGLSQEDQLIKELTGSMPLTPDLLKLSNEKIINSYYDIAGFYKDELKDLPEAIRMYRLILERYPANGYEASIYYNLYRLYSGKDAAAAASYRDRLVKEFPESLFAKVVLDPDFARKTDQQTSQLNEAYNATYLAYAERRYADAMTLADKARRQFGVTALSPQLAYLHTLALGHFQKISPFEDSLRSIATFYPTDQVVVPLIRQQLDFIKANRDLLEPRPVALIDRNFSEPAQSILPEPPPVRQQVPVIAAQPEQKKPDATTTQPESDPVLRKTVPVSLPLEQPKQAGTGLVVNGSTAAIVVPEAGRALFDLPETADYYFVINVLDPALNMNPTRFGLGQYLRSNYSGTGVRHQTRELKNENQLIYVGKFTSLSDAQAYRRRMAPLLRDIVKIPAEKYNTFVITGSELEKLNDRNAVQRYADFFRGVQD